MLGTQITKHLNDIAQKDENSYFVYIDGYRYPWVGDIEKEYPERVIACGISEANAISIATGLALSGKSVYVFMISAYAVKRALDQLKFAAYCNANITIITTLAGFAVPYAGYSHLSLDDVSILRNTPNLEIYCPSTVPEIDVIMQHITNRKGPAYIGIDNRGTLPPIKKYKYGEKSVIHYGNDKSLCILFTGFVGSFLFHEFRILQKLLQKGINPAIYSIYMMEPFNSDEIKNLCKKHSHIVTLEFKGKGALASSVSEIIATEKFKTKLLPIYLKDEKYNLMGQCGYVADKYIDLSHLDKKIEKFLNRKNLFFYQKKCSQRGAMTKTKYKLFGLTLFKTVENASSITSFLLGFIKIYRKTI